MARAFVNSPFAARWTREFQGLTPGTAPFNVAWRRVAAREPEAFEEAQYQFLRLENYGSLATRLRRSTGLDLDGLSRTVRDVAWSTSVQHSWNDRLGIFRNAAREADRLVGRGNPGYDEALIRQVYAERIRVALRIRNSSSGGDWQTFNNLATIRFPREMNNALAMLRQEQQR